MGQAEVEAFRAAQREEEDSNARSGVGNDSPTRVVMRYPPEPTQLLISGGLVAGGELANTPALVDSQRGNGHVVMFSFNPFWRGETLGSYSMVLNAVLHHDHLGVGR